MKLDPVYTAAWIGWGVFFALVEGLALMRPKDKPNGTLSWNIRNLLYLGSRTRWEGRVLAAIFLAWLVTHFMWPVVK